MAQRILIIVPCYNEGEVLNTTVQELVDLHYEVVVVDDGSQDASPEISRAYSDAHANFRVVRQENAGVGAARERGRLAARGRYLAFIDADDLWHPRKLEKQLATFGGKNHGKYTRQNSSKNR